jgi:hypothetical protein
MTGVNLAVAISDLKAVGGSLFTAAFAADGRP